MHVLFSACFFLALLQQSHAKKFPECDAQYVCYVFPTEDNVITPVNGAKEVRDDFRAMVKIHAYSEKHYDVFVASSKNGVSSIKVTMNDEHMFTCEKEGNYSVLKIETETKLTELFKEPLSCTGEIRATEKIADTDKGAKIGLEIMAGTSTQKGKVTHVLDHTDFSFCDPDKMKYKTDIMKKTEHYKQVKTRLNTFYCGDKYKEGADHKFLNGLYGIEYRKQGEKEYRKVKSMKCGKPPESNGVSSTKQFLLEFDDGGASEYVEGNKEIEVRCAADAQYFCEYSPKPTEGRQPFLFEKTVGNVSTLKCPDSHPFSVVNGKPEKNPVFHCHNKRGRLQWTYEGITLSHDKETATYCSDEVECHISPEFLHQSFLNEENVPMCHDEGELQVQESPSKEVKIGVEKFTCERKGGKVFYHTKSGGRKEWLGGMHVFCHYGDKAADENKQNKNKIVLIALSSAVGAFLIVGGIFGCFFYFNLRRRSRKQNRLSGDANKDENRFSRVMGRVDPQSSGSEKKKKKKSSTASNVDEPSSGPAVERGQEGKGMFTEANAPLVELEPPPYDKAAIEDAYGDDEWWDDELPEGYEMPMREEARPLIERLMEKHGEPLEAVWREVYAWKEKEKKKEEKKNGEKKKEKEKEENGEKKTADEKKKN